MAGPPKREKRNAMIALLEQGEDSILETENVLARLWRIILISERLGGEDWLKRITRFQEKISRLSSKKGSANMKGNLTRSLAEPRLSWGTLMQGLGIMNYSKVEIHFHLTRGNETKVIPLVVHQDEFESCEDHGKDES